MATADSAPHADIGHVIALPKITDPRGNLTVAEEMKNVPFDIARVYWTYDIPAGESRGGHAHRTCQEIIVAVSGSFDVTLDDGSHRQTYHLNHPYQGLYVGTGIWRTLDDFSSGAVCLVLASELFDEQEYIYDYDEFIRIARQGSNQ
ncbi:MAG: FdtA/QdtA family cupin domain-containing protein [Prevotella sp.]|nr:FdtA/QdtA family cupin domain-containing protein [Prevotella sp.]